MNKQQFQEQVMESPKPVIVDLWAPWCTPCRAMEPAFKKISEKFSGEVDVVKVNVDQSPEVAQLLGVMSIPTVIGFSGGKQVMRRSGMQSAEALDILFDATLHGRKPDIIPPAPVDRIVRSIAGLGLMAAGWFISGHSLPLLILGGVVLFSAFYDRCPIFRAVFPKVKALFQR